MKVGFMWHFCQISCTFPYFMSIFIKKEAHCFYEGSMLTLISQGGDI